MVGFGDSGGDDKPKYNTSVINFNPPFKGIKSEKRRLSFTGFSAISCMCDPYGNFLFYSNGCRIVNAVEQVIEGSENMNYAGGKSSEADCQDTIYKEGYDIQMGLISLPVDAANGRYILIHKDEDEDWDHPIYKVFVPHLYATTLDMQANNGAGKVIKQQIILKDTLAFSDLTACKHSNGKDWWVMTMKAWSNKFYKFLIQKDTILGPFVQYIGDDWHYGPDVCQAVFSPDGKQYARVNWCNGVMLYDFDRSTGELSNYRNYGKGCASNSDSIKLCGVAFSPNSQYLYASGWMKMFQFDTKIQDLNATIKTIGVFDGYRDTIGLGPPVPQPFFVMANGPDCKIYATAPKQGRVFHVIHNPDLPAPHCNFQQHGLRLPTYRAFNIPNFAHYRLGTNMPVCDSTLSIVSAVWGLPVAEVVAQIRPSPTTGPAVLDVDLHHHRAGHLILYDLSGQVVHHEQINNLQLSYDLDLSGLRPGLYIYAVQVAGGVAARGKVVVVRDE